MATGGNGHEPTTQCQLHDADIGQLQNDMRLFARELREHGGRMDEQDKINGQLVADIGRTVRAAERAAEKASAAADAALSAVAEVRKLSEAKVRLSGRIADLEQRMVSERPSLSGKINPMPPLDYDGDDLSEETKTNLRVLDRDGLLNLFIQERAARAAAEARVSERDRASLRVREETKQSTEYRLAWWKLVLGAVATLASGGGVVALLQHFLHVTP